MVGPAPIPEEAFAQVGKGGWAEHIEDHCGEPPDVWHRWMRNTELGLFGGPGHRLQGRHDAGGEGR